MNLAQQVEEKLNLIEQRIKQRCDVLSANDAMLQNLIGRKEELTQVLVALKTEEKAEIRADVASDVALD